MTSLRRTVRITQITKNSTDNCLYLFESEPYLLANYTETLLTIVHELFRFAVSSKWYSENKRMHVTMSIPQM